MEWSARVMSGPLCLLQSSAFPDGGVCYRWVTDISSGAMTGCREGPVRYSSNQENIECRCGGCILRMTCQ